MYILLKWLSENFSMVCRDSGDIVEWEKVWSIPIYVFLGHPFVYMYVIVGNFCIALFQKTITLGSLKVSNRDILELWSQKYDLFLFLNSLDYGTLNPKKRIIY